MKKLSKILALLLALCVALSVCAFASGEPSGEASGDPSGEASGKSVEEAYIDYLREFLTAELEVNSSMMPEHVEEIIAAVEAGQTDVFPGDILFNGMLVSGTAMTFDEFAAQYVPEGGSGEISVEDAFIDYIHQWLLDELEVNANMTIEQVEDEFMPLVEQMNFVDFPAEMIYSGMLEQGVPMTFEEFAAQYVPAAGAGGYTADEAGYKAYLKDWVAACPAVQANIDEFNAGIDAGAYFEFPMEMCFTDQWFGFAALTYDQFIAAGGVAEIPAFDPNLAPD